MDRKQWIDAVTQLAWRNLWKHRRRTVLTMLTIITGTTMILFLNAFAKGGHDQMIEDAISLYTGHIQIHEKGYHENQSLEYAFIPSKELLETLDTSPHIAGYGRRVVNGALLASGEKSTGAQITGVEPEKEKDIIELYNKVLPGGSWLEPGENSQILLGEGLSRKLDVTVGDEVAMLSQGFDGSIAADIFIVKGILKTGTPDLDRVVAFITYSTADRLFTMMDYVNTITIRLTRNDAGEKVTSAIKAVSDTDTIEILQWPQLLPELVQFIVMDDIGAYIFDMILFMVVALGILNTIQMSVFERTREFGVMMAIGTRPSMVTAMIMLESFFITLMGTSIGLVIGGLLSWYFNSNPINISGYAGEMAVWGVNSTLFPTRLTMLNVSVTSLLTLGLALIFSWFPARRAARLRPVDAIRHL